MTINRKLNVVEEVNENIKRIKITSTDDASSVANEISDLQTDDANTVHKDDTDASNWSFVDNDTSLTSNADELIPTQKAVKAYADGLVTDMVSTNDDVTALSPLGENNIAAITDTGELAVAPNTIAAVNGILTILINAGLMDAPT